ncbi:MAG TPA: serine hydrolase domain-containing protein [Verrucomicrobiae bacterium]|jgi:CubicO group peptidase (beta-lactamase class C family)
MNFSIWRLRIIAAAWILAASAAFSASLSDVESQARTQMAEFAGKVPGLSVAIGQDGKILWSECLGYADLEAKKPVTPRTLFRIGSVSKPMTAAGLMLLVEKGKVDLDADIHRYVPDFPEKGHVITTRQLAGHLAGIRHYKPGEFYMNRHFNNARDGLRIFENDPLLSVPGQKYFYSSYGFNLISAVMEAAAGQDFLPYMQEAVWTPLDLTNTMPDDATRSIPERTHFYVAKAGGGFKLEPDVDNSYKWASGGFLSTPEDLVRFGSAHLQPGFLTSASLKALFTPQKTTDGKPTGYGIGWTIQRDKSGHRIWMHTGGSVGGTTVLMIQPDSGLVLAMTANCTDAPLNKSPTGVILQEFEPLFLAQ